MKLTSTTFTDNDSIPVQYTRDTSNFSPGMQWSDSPETTQCFALTCINSDAPAARSVHWIIYNIPAPAYMLAPKIAHQAQHPSGMQQAVNSWGEYGYTGPQAADTVQHYVFTLFALDSSLHLPPETDREMFMKTIKEHTLATACITGHY